MTSLSVVMYSCSTIQLQYLISFYHKLFPSCPLCYGLGHGIVFCFLFFVLQFSMEVACIAYEFHFRRVKEVL